MTDDVCMFVKSLILNKSSLNTYVKVAKVYYSFILLGWRERSLVAQLVKNLLTMRETWV